MTSRGICGGSGLRACSPVVRPPAPNDMDNGIRFWSEWNRRTGKGTDGWHGAMAGPKSEDNFSLSAFLLQLLAPPEGGREGGEGGCPGAG